MSECYMLLQLCLIYIIEFIWKCAVDGCCLFAYQLPSKELSTLRPLYMIWEAHL